MSRKGWESGPELRWRLSLSWLALAWERIWPAFWPLVALAGVFAVLALLDLLPLLPSWLHVLVLGAFLLAAAAATVQAVRKLRWPHGDAAMRRLETTNDLPHRPLTAVTDDLALGSGDPQTLALWQAHRRRLAAQLGRLRIALPRAGLASVDPYGLRAVVVLLLIIAAAGGLDSWQNRLERAVSPAFAAASQEPTSLSAWINPPSYTGLAPLFLDPKNVTSFDIPAGSRFLAQVQGGSESPELVSAAGRAAFERIGSNLYRLEEVLREPEEAAEGDAPTPESAPGDRLTIEQNGSAIASWPVTLIPDNPPQSEFTAAPSRTERSSLRLDYLAQDDYGVAGLIAKIHRIDKPEAEPIELEMVLAQRYARSVEGSSFHDLTPHPWAGLAVEIELTALDAIEQTGISDRVRTVLPERIFNHPVARALVELRKQLTLEPDVRLPVVQSLNELSDRPDHFFHDMAVALALYTASRRLIHDKSDAAVGQVQKLMWDTALRIEEGELAIAEQDLREIQEALMEALAKGAETEEIERLLDQLQQALDNFVEALAEQMQQQMAEGAEPQPLPPDAQMMQRQDLQEMIDRAREMARNGMQDAARDLLAQLQEMLENLRAQPFAQGMNEEMREAQSMMRDLESMMQRQQELLDRSFRRSQERNNSQEGQAQQRSESRQDAQGQESLRRDLGELMRQLGEMMGDIPKPLGRAEREMRSARDALEGENHHDAVRPQARSMDQLQQGMQSMAESFMQMMGAQQDQGTGNVGARPGFGNDPLGRSTGRGAREAMEGVQIPDQMDVQRSREILDELRRRSGERSRPPVELDYIDRLLRQF